MSPHLTQSLAKAQLDDRLRSADRQRVAVQACASRTARAAQLGRRRLGLRALRAVFG
jgi:hypothetical protein